MAHFMTHIPRYVYLSISVIMGNVIKSARALHLDYCSPPVLKWGKYKYCVRFFVNSLVQIFHVTSFLTQIRNSVTSIAA